MMYSMIINSFGKVYQDRKHGHHACNPGTLSQNWLRSKSTLYRMNLKLT